jgi:hypothetical protein
VVDVEDELVAEEVVMEFVDAQTIVRASFWVVV